jgi:hypothetical protein
MRHGRGVGACGGVAALQVLGACPPGTTACDKSGKCEECDSTIRSVTGVRKLQHISYQVCVKCGEHNSVECIMCDNLIRHTLAHQQALWQAGQRGHVEGLRSGVAALKPSC